MLLYVQCNNALALCDMKCCGCVLCSANFEKQLADKKISEQLRKELTDLLPLVCVAELSRLVV